MFTICSPLAFTHKPMTHHYTYILAGQTYGPIFIGTARNLKRRMSQHRFGLATVDAFRIDQLVYVERHDSIEAATARAEALKAASREWVDALVERKNPDWRDLSEIAKERLQRVA